MDPPSVKPEITYTLGLHCGRVNFAIENYTAIELVGLINEMRNEIPFCIQLVIDWNARLDEELGPQSEEWKRDTEQALEAKQFWIEIRWGSDPTALLPEDLQLTPLQRYQRALARKDLPDGTLELSHLPIEFPFRDSSNQLTDRLFAVLE